MYSSHKPDSHETIFWFYTEVLRNNTNCLSRTAIVLCLQHCRHPVGRIFVRAVLRQGLHRSLKAFCESGGVPTVADVVPETFYLSGTGAALQPDGSPRDARGDERAQYVDFCSAMTVAPPPSTTTTDTDARRCGTTTEGSSGGGSGSSGSSTAETSRVDEIRSASPLPRSFPKAEASPGVEVAAFAPKHGDLAVTAREEEKTNGATEMPASRSPTASSDGARSSRDSQEACTTVVVDPSGPPGTPEALATTTALRAVHGGDPPSLLLVQGASCSTPGLELADPTPDGVAPAGGPAESSSSASDGGELRKGEIARGGGGERGGGGAAWGVPTWVVKPAANSNCGFGIQVCCSQEVSCNNNSR